MTAMLGLGGHTKALFSEPSLLWEAVRAGLALRRRRRPGISRHIWNGACTPPTGPTMTGPPTMTWFTICGGAGR